jgi:hypothetical protein
MFCKCNDGYSKCHTHLSSFTPLSISPLQPPTQRLMLKRCQHLTAPGFQHKEFSNLAKAKNLKDFAAHLTSCPVKVYHQLHSLVICPLDGTQIALCSSLVTSPVPCQVMSCLLDCAVFKHHCTDLAEPLCLLGCGVLVCISSPALCLMPLSWLWAC